MASMSAGRKLPMVWQVMTGVLWRCRGGTRSCTSLHPLHYTAACTVDTALLQPLHYTEAATVDTAVVAAYSARHTALHCR